MSFDYVGRFETLDRDLRHVCETLGFPNLRLPFAQAATVPRSYRDYYTPATRRLVADRFSKDFRLFGYDVDVL